MVWCATGGAAVSARMVYAAPPRTTRTSNETSAMPTMPRRRLPEAGDVGAGTPAPEWGAAVATVTLAGVACAGWLAGAGAFVALGMLRARTGWVGVCVSPMGAPQVRQTVAPVS